MCFFCLRARLIEDLLSRQEERKVMMAHQENIPQTSSESQEAFLPLEEQQLEQVTGGTGAAANRAPQLHVRNVRADEDRNHPNNGTYIPPSDPDALKLVRNFGVDISQIPENHSYTFHPNGIDVIRHERPSY
jgi:hypothetical protein